IRHIRHITVGSSVENRLSAKAGSERCEDWGIHVSVMQELAMSTAEGGFAIAPSHPLAVSLVAGALLLLGLARRQQRLRAEAVAERPHPAAHPPLPAEARAMLRAGDDGILPAAPRRS